MVADRTEKDYKRVVHEGTDAPTFTYQSLRLYVGGAIFFTALPFFAPQIAACTFWEFIDKKTINGVEKVKAFGASLEKYWKPYVRHAEDAFIPNMLLMLGVFIPLYALLELYLTVTYGFSWIRLFIFHLIRIGPMYSNFAWIYTLCHKEGHQLGLTGFFKKPVHYFLSKAFNHWVGLFYGVLPGTFTYSHTRNHHYYDNGRLDIYSTQSFMRDSFTNYLRYIATWWLYALNISTVYSFVELGNYNLALQTAFGTVGYLVFLRLFYAVSPIFTLAYMVYPLFDSNLLLSMVNFTWHAFIDPENIDDDYVNSTTVLDAQNFILGEEYHVIHHASAGVHWTKHTPLFEKDLAAGFYDCPKSSSFTGTNLFIIFGHIVGQKYEELAKLQYDPENQSKLTLKEKAAILRRRLQTTIEHVHV
eukprot:TRINITY_DN10733_c0_g1_i1.p1 TRINITY_DN10733_c0_g1~~TRINITY_DN10733_c0_g1_i1.p1  ORF type:complete len:416 (-),score=103.92 TRINITY_DN10733_c0_g1_i1:127-1374(-)